MLGFGWNATGVIAERRELKSQKDQKVWRHVFRVTTLGAEFEAIVTPEVFARHGEGEMVVMDGTFRFFNGKAEFVVKHCAPDNGAVPASKPSGKA